MDWYPMGSVGFPDYNINEYGHIFSVKRNKVVDPSINQAGIPYVYIRDSEDERQTRSISHLVASIFLDTPQDPSLNTLIRKDGSKVNTHKDNLAWRTRSYAINYHKELELNRVGMFPYPVYALEAGDGRHVRFKNMREAVIRYGVREVELFDNLAAGVPIFFAPHVTMYKA